MPVRTALSEPPRDRARTGEWASFDLHNPANYLPSHRIRKSLTREPPSHQLAVISPPVDGRRLVIGGGYEPRNTVIRWAVCESNAEAFLLRSLSNRTFSKRCKGGS